MKCVDDRLSRVDGNGNGVAEVCVFVANRDTKCQEYGHLINDSYLSCYIALETDDKIEVVCLLEDKKCFYTVDLLVDGLLCRTMLFKPKKKARFPTTFDTIIGRKTAARNWTKGEMVIEAVSDAVEVSTVGHFPKIGIIEVMVYRGDPGSVNTPSCKNLAPSVMGNTFYPPKQEPHPEILPKHRVIVTDEIEMKASACTRARRDFAADRPGNGPWATFCFLYRSLESIQGCPTRTLKASSSLLHFRSSAPTLPLTSQTDGLFVQRGENESSEDEDTEESDGQEQVDEAQSQAQGRHITQPNAVKNKSVSASGEIAIPSAHGRYRFAQSELIPREDSPTLSGSTKTSEIKTEEPVKSTIQIRPMENVLRDTSLQPSQTSTESIASSSFDSIQCCPLSFCQINIPRGNPQTTEKDGYESRIQAGKRPKQVTEKETEAVTDELTEETTEKRSEQQTSETEKELREENPPAALDHLEKTFATHNLDESHEKMHNLAQKLIQTPLQPKAQSENPAFASSHSYSQTQTTLQHSTLPTTDVAPYQVALVPCKSDSLKRASSAGRPEGEPDAKRACKSTSPKSGDIEALKAKINETKKRGLKKQEENRKMIAKIEASEAERTLRKEFAALQKQLVEADRFLAEQDEEEKRLKRLDEEASDMEE